MSAWADKITEELKGLHEDIAALRRLNTRTGIVKRDEMTLRREIARAGRQTIAVPALLFDDVGAAAAAQAASQPLNSTLTALAALSPQGFERLLYTNSSIPGGNTIANTTTETAFNTAPAIAANYLVAGQRIRSVYGGVFSTDVIAPTITGAIRYGGASGTVLAATGAISALVGASSNLGWFAQVEHSFRSVGASAVVETRALLAFSTSAVAAVTIVPAVNGTTAPDTASMGSLVLTVTWGTANAANTITLRDVAHWISG